MTEDEAKKQGEALVCVDFYNSTVRCWLHMYWDEKTGSWYDYVTCDRDLGKYIAFLPVPRWPGLGHF